MSFIINFLYAFLYLFSSNDNNYRYFSSTSHSSFCMTIIFLTKFFVTDSLNLYTDYNMHDILKSESKCFIQCCGQTFKKVKYFRYHKKWECGKVFVCSKCNSVLKTRATYLSHTRRYCKAPN